MRSTPRLLICTPSHSTQGGVEQIIENLAHGLPARGFEVVVGLAKGLRFHAPAAYRARFPDLQTIEIDGTGGTRRARVAAIRKVIKRTSPELVLIARMFDVYPAVAGLKSEGFRTRLTVTIDAYESEYVSDIARYSESVDYCVTSGQLIRDAVVALARLPPDRVVSIPGGIKPPHHARRPRQPGDPLRIAYVGRLAQTQKRALDLIPFLTGLRDAGIPFTCSVAGAGPDEEMLKQEIEMAGLAGRVSFRGWLPLSELYSVVYPETDVLIHFAEWEGITIAPREAMAHGVVPVISEFTGLAREGIFIDSENSLTFPIGDIGKAVSQTGRLFHEHDLHTRLSRAASDPPQGDRSFEGALDAWSLAFHRAIDLPSRVAPRPPVLPGPEGRLGRLPSGLAESFRRLSGKVPLHRDPGAEWPHWSGVMLAGFPEAMADIARPVLRPEKTVRH
jgi:glycosyltransferase involved in cell wall biosynthesis